MGRFSLKTNFWSIKEKSENRKHRLIYNEHYIFSCHLHHFLGPSNFLCSQLIQLHFYINIYTFPTFYTSWNCIHEEWCETDAGMASASSIVLMNVSHIPWHSLFKRMFQFAPSRFTTGSIPTTTVPIVSMSLFTELAVFRALHYTMRVYSSCEMHKYLSIFCDT